MGTDEADEGVGFPLQRVRIFIAASSAMTMEKKS